MSATAASSRPDVLVVGAGIVGAACALTLARAGLRVEVLDASLPGGGATAEGMGHLVLTGEGPELALGRLSLELWRAELPRLGPGSDPHLCGTLWLAEDAAQLEVARQMAGRLAGLGVEAELLDSAQLREAEPRLAEGLAGALRVAGDGVVYPPAVVAGWLAEVEREHGGAVRVGVRVRKIRSGGGDPELELADGTRRSARWIVNAAGCRALELLESPPLGLPIRPRKGHLLISDRHPGFCRHELVELGYLAGAQSADGEAVAFNLQPRPNGQLLLGSSRQFGDEDRRAEPRIVGKVAVRALRFVPDLREVEILRVWTGFRAATADHLPILGPVPGCERVLLAAGHEGLGITTSLGSARLLADEILGRESPIPRAPYRADRVQQELAHA